MAGADIFRLILLLLVTVVWAVLTWGIHKKLHARAAASGTSASAELGKWFGAADDRKERNTFLFMTFVLAVMVALRVLA